MADRLSSLLQRFALHAHVVHAGRLPAPLAFGSDLDDGDAGGHLHLLRGPAIDLIDADGRRLPLPVPGLLFAPRALVHQLAPGAAADPDGGGAELVSARVSFGIGDENPLLRSLPPLLQFSHAELPSLAAVQHLLFDEVAGQRCGLGAVLDRLCEVLVIQLLRHTIQHQLVDSGVLAGLADTRLSKAINAVHAEPARPWNLQAMADAAGMSRARFAAHFTHTLGLPPGDYLTAWRLGLARTLLRQGKSVKQVAAEVGYRSASGFGRAFLQRLGSSPMDWRHQHTIPDNI